jgi:peptidoglycan L-alanyl-D-glutamate endopeptidase CwlK
MPTFGPRSLSRLNTCHNDLRRVALRAIEVYDFTILEGARTIERQEHLIEIGATRVRDPRSSLHVVIPGVRDTAHAVDIAPWHETEPHIRWEDTRAWAVLWGVWLACATREGVPLRWGGDWNRDRAYTDNRFNDLGHIELAY